MPASLKERYRCRGITHRAGAAAAALMDESRDERDARLSAVRPYYPAARRGLAEPSRHRREQMVVQKPVNKHQLSYRGKSQPSYAEYPGPDFWRRRRLRYAPAPRANIHFARIIFVPASLQPAAKIQYL